MGDQAAAAEFVRSTQADVWRLCRHLGDPGNADDLTQETYARAFAALPRFAGRSSARTWLLAIARRVCVDAVRVAVRERKLPAEVLPAAADPAETSRVRAMLGRLTADRQEAFVLTQLIGLSYAEAADVCHCPIGTIRSRVARAREDLIVAFGDEHRDAAGS